MDTRDSRAVVCALHPRIFTGSGRIWRCQSVNSVAIVCASAIVNRSRTPCS